MSETELTPALREELIEASRRALPEEACGIVLGHHGVIREIAGMTNQARRPADHFALDPLEYMHAERDAGKRGLDVIGIWHSHPDGEAVPSESDRRAAWAGWLYLIVGSPGDGGAEIRGWRLNGSRFEEEVLR
ncbi:M67 family metallopeptidase [Aquisalimonas sp.]|uniref:M67 family metallopeptidase n=1 Tax=unclassified Aquisalimonas TaxID=2644645 RepID=UPI0025BA55F2|nr:M67 family metallopeptidase [Aquisalimonas sp.]